jgi:hypothetical protein
MRPSERSALLEDLVRVALPVNALPSQTVGLGNADLWAHAKPKDVARTVERLRAGQLRVWINPWGVGFNRFLVNADTVREFRGYSLRSPRRNERQLALL